MRHGLFWVGRFGDKCHQSLGHGVYASANGTWIVSQVAGVNGFAKTALVRALARSLEASGANLAWPPSRNPQYPRSGFRTHARLEPAKVLQVSIAADVLADLLENLR